MAFFSDLTALLTRVRNGSNVSGLGGSRFNIMQLLYGRKITTGGEEHIGNRVTSYRRTEVGSLFTRARRIPSKAA